MQLHEAAAQYLTHREALDNYADGTFYEDHVWRVFPYSEGGYFLGLHAAVSELPTDGTQEAWDYARTVTKQRGGTRVFKTLDAVASALQQIGQPVLPLDDLPKPDGL